MRSQVELNLLASGVAEILGNAKTTAAIDHVQNIAILKKDHMNGSITGHHLAEIDRQFWKRRFTVRGR